MAKSNLKDFTDTAQSTTNEEIEVEAEVMEEYSVSTNNEAALNIVKTNTYLSMGVSLIPFPLVDTVGLAALQFRTVQQLSELYGVKLKENQIKAIVASVASGFSAPAIGDYLSRSALKSVPIFGTALSMAATPVVAGALSYAIGKVFIQHFESGCTFLTFDPVKVHRYFKAYYKEGLDVASSMKAQAASS